MVSNQETLLHKTRANHLKRIAWGGHLWLDVGANPALVFRAHGILQKRYELRIPLAEIASVASDRNWRVVLKNGEVERFLVAPRTGLAGALADARNPKRRVSSAGSGDDDDRPHYWATGSYDPERYYRETAGMSKEFLAYVRDAYGDLDTYEANRPH